MTSGSTQAALSRPSSAMVSDASTDAGASPLGRGRVSAEDVLRIECNVDFEAFRRLEREWHELCAQCPSATMFNSWEWLFSWWQTYRGARELRLILVRSGGALVAVLPLCLSREPVVGPLMARVLRFVGDGSYDSDYLDWIVRSGDEDRVVAALARWFAENRDWDALRLRELPPQSTLAPRLEVLRAAVSGRVQVETGRTGVIPLPATLEEFLRGRQSRFRTKLRALLRSMDTAGITLEVSCPPHQLRSRLRSLFALHQRRWQSAGEPGVFGGRTKRLFYARFAPRFSRRGWLRLYTLQSAAGPVAHQLCFGTAGTTYLLQEGFDVTNPNASYGQMLRIAVMKHLIESGETHYDFLGGVTRHKEGWGAIEQEVSHVSIVRPTVAGRMTIAWPLFREQVGQFLKRYLPPRIVDRLRGRGG